MRTHHLYPGELRVTDEPELISTILGSCVAVAIYDPVARVGGLNHFLLDSPPPGETPSPRYGSYAIPALVEALIRMGGIPSNFRAKVYGGSNVLIELTDTLEIGSKNVRFALSKLEELGIPVLERDTGGSAGRRIVFSTEDFSVDSITNSHVRAC